MKRRVTKSPISVQVQTDFRDQPCRNNRKVIADLGIVKMRLFGLTQLLLGSWPQTAGNY